ncbi:caspase family protein [Emticicia sp. C21]|uniref:caspase family protein n=1 Tax=Emticicia sp. C21 TaxID=2302915 RepID=UPI000E34B938|nr:caspase family protein [Emticicia sp. C21]RFS15580.1 caspase family protein [Emticicia sp. C21]
MMNKRLHFFCLFFLVNSFLYAQTPTTHFLLFFDTNDPYVGPSAEITYGRMMELIDKISKHSETQKDLVLIKGDNLTVEKVDETIQKLVIKEKDIIFFYFVGHGWNNSQSEFPMLKIGGDGITLENSRSLEEIYSQLLEKKARSTFVFAEACNTSKAVKPKKKNDGEEDHSRYNINPSHVRTLFRQTKVNIIMSSSKRGQESFSNYFGGYFSNSFRSVFDKMTSKEYLEQPSWDEILVEIQEATREVSGDKQNPILNIDYYETDHTNSSLLANKECPLNMTAFNKVSEDLFFLNKYWKEILNYEKDFATETYETFYQIEVQEFYDHLLEKLNLIEHLSDADKKWYNNTAKEVSTYLKTINKYKEEDTFKSKAFSKLSIPIDNLKQLHGKLDEFRKRCRE